MPLRRFNQDAHYKEAICNVIDFKHPRLEQLVKAAYDDDADPQSTGLIVAAKTGHGKTVAALLSAGASADARDKVWLL